MLINPDSILVCSVDFGFTLHPAQFTTGNTFEA